MAGAGASGLHPGRRGVGRRGRRWRDDDPTTHGPGHAAPVICPLCERRIPAGARQSRHHLTPKLKGGTHDGTVRLHQICHSAIHARYSEAEIARRLADVARLREDPEIARFLAWVRTKPDDFHAATRLTRDRREARRQAR
ncbi:restriction endonuclease [Methylobacterium oryzisoli]|uniref:restriction endonuclease n=1 Tax=Methylobacterium oryzisoli TaxID=3385502 RepID=UPI0038923D85